MQQLADTRTTVCITHHYAASPSRVFDAWLDPQLAGLWLFATASRPMKSVAIDARAGGAFCFVERRAGSLIEHRGRYVEITRPQRLVLMLDSPDCAPKEVPLGAADTSRVTAELKAENKACTLQLIHDGLPEHHAARIEARWTGMLYGLALVLSRHDTRI